MRATVLRLLLVAGVVAGCVDPPEAERDGGTTCRTEGDCNPGGTCGPIRLCIQGYCSDDRVFRACPDGRYPDATPVVGECLTYVNCNTTSCGSLIPCINNRCDQGAPRLQVACDGGR